MVRDNSTLVRPRRRLGSALGIGALLVVGMGAGTLHAQAAPATTSTTTTMTTSVNPATSGSAVTLTATLAALPAGATLPPGNVVFKDGPTPVGLAQVVPGGSTTGTAEVSDTFTKAGSGRHMLTATFTPTSGTVPASSGAFTEDVLGTTATFVQAAYVTMLGHPGDAGGISFWIDRIANQGFPRSALASNLVTLAEYRRNVISGNLNSGSGLDFYNLYLDRAFDAPGADYWVGRMAGIGGAMLTFEQVRLNFAGSPEYFSSTAVGNNDKLTAIRALYSDLLGRTDGGDSDTTGQAYWSSHYNATTIASQFLFSPEGRAYLVNAVYHQILNRAAENPGGLPYWSNLLLSGASDENIVASILSSTEYFDSH